MHPNAYKGLKAWVALHAVPHGGMTMKELRNKNVKSVFGGIGIYFAVVCFDGANVVVGNGYQL